MVNKVFVKLAFSILILFFVIEGFLLFFSLQNKERELLELRKVEQAQYSQNKIYTIEYIEQTTSKFYRDILLMTLLISIFVILGFFGIYRHFIGRYLSVIIEMNRSFSLDEPSPIRVFKKIPKDEMGDFILSRSFMISRLKKQLEENKKLVRILSHDLNNSISVILMSAEIYEIKRKEMNSVIVKNLMAKIKMAGESQKALIDSVRNIYALKDGKVDTELKKESFRKIFEKTFMMFDEKLKNKKIQMYFENEDDEDFEIMVNGTLFFNNVLNNLISNSIKFTQEEGKIMIRTKTNKEGKKVITVSDTGLGISKKILEVLFSPYKKTTRMGTAGEQGTGFGMPLVKETIVSFGGTIEVDSKVIDEHPDDHGTTFTMVLS